MSGTTCTVAYLPKPAGEKWVGQKIYVRRIFLKIGDETPVREEFFGVILSEFPSGWCSLVASGILPYFILSSRTVVTQSRCSSPMTRRTPPGKV